MSTRIFQIDSYNNGEPDTIRFFEESEINTRYNMYGFYRKDESFKDNLNEYRTQRSEEFSDFKEENPSFTLSDVKEFLEEFQNNYEYTDNHNNDCEGRPVPYLLFEDSEDYMFDDTDDFVDEDRKPAGECSPEEYVSEWDGHNHKELILTNDFGTVDNVTEITDKYEGIDDRWVKLGSTWEHNATTWNEYYYDEETDSLWNYHASLWQGSTPDYEIVSEEFLTSFDLKEDEKLFFDGDAICFSKGEEEYHFSLDEIIETGPDYSQEFSTSIILDLDVAREAIEIRLLEKKGIENLPLEKIFVQYEDSIQAGNCHEISDRVKDIIALKENIEGEYAYRADKLLAIRNDDYSHRAIVKAYMNGHFIHS